MISVIVPVYNVETYLRICLDSIINQTYKELEIILVNDGSTDNSGAICDEYAQKDKRIKVIHKANGGVSSARNVALKISRGDYVGFVDSDDYLHKDYFLMLYTYIKRNDCDLSICSMKFFNDIESLSFEKFKNSNENKISLNRKQVFEEMISNKKIYGFLWNKLFKKDLINIPFAENIHFTEDFLFCAQYVQNIKKAIFIDLPLYYYRQNRENSITSNTLKYDNKIFSSLEGQLKIMEIYQKNNIKLTNYFEYIILNNALNLLGKYKYNNINNKVQKNIIHHSIKKFYKICVKKSKFTYKIRYFIRRRFPKLYFKHQYQALLK